MSVTPVTYFCWVRIRQRPQSALLCRQQPARPAVLPPARQYLPQRCRPKVQHRVHQQALVQLPRQRPQSVLLCRQQPARQYPPQRCRPKVQHRVHRQALVQLPQQALLWGPRQRPQPVLPAVLPLARQYRPQRCRPEVQHRVHRQALVQLPQQALLWGPRQRPQPVLPAVLPLARQYRPQRCRPEVQHRVHRQALVQLPQQALLWAPRQRPQSVLLCRPQPAQPPPLLPVLQCRPRLHLHQPRRTICVNLDRTLPTSLRAGVQAAQLMHTTLEPRRKLIHIQTYRRACSSAVLAIVGTSWWSLGM